MGDSKVTEREGNYPKFLAVGFLMGLAGTALTFFGSGMERFWINWIVWVLFFLTIGLGCLFLVALEHVVGARWSVPLRRIPERLSGLALLMTPATLIALFSLPVLYPWTRSEDPVIAGKAVWLNVPFFSLRVLICLVIWAFSYWIFVSGSMQQDRHGNPRYTVRVRRFAPLFMILFGITLTIVAFDWISSLDPTWYSDIFGVYLFAGTFLAGLAITTLTVLYLKRQGRLSEIKPDHLYNLGGFLFAFIVFWSYIGFAQYLLMWYANMPEEVFWYKARLSGGWGIILLAMAFFHFLVPFFVLIARDAKTNPRILFSSAALILFSHLLDLYWMIFPTLGKGPVFGWQELSFAFLFVSAALLWVRRSMNRGADMPIGDPMLREGLEFRL
jgi:hypothetical protein